MDFVFVLLAYLAGSIPFGLILTNIWGKGNLRSSGSGNIGATNVFRTHGTMLGLLTFFLDFLKGFLVCKYFGCENETASLLLIAVPVLGHIYSPWLKWRGGKGVATYLGVVGALNPSALFCSTLVWWTVFAIVRISSVASIASVLFACAFFYHLSPFSCNFINQLYVLITLAVIIVWKHHDNLKQLLNGKKSSP
ncbi:MAG: glycerol-3-phosphate 1-O-acyltransferase PlsY [Holosporaceae bacterium]|jgi:glycerol-3-phosphate acyltransferase PlsY|nr:glycerol-3-phosphate 1-O-acyltransferase PlsY [Holosporaceae bacterium]